MWHLSCRKTFALLLATAVSVDAHGFLESITIDGTLYKGNLPAANPFQSVIRQVKDISPVQGASNPDLNCGMSAQMAPLIADANPGSNIAFKWSGGDYQLWPHNTGPMLTYMASCGSSPCNQYDSTQAKWFKIQQVGRKDDGNWAQVDIKAGAQATITLPATLAPGNYLIRHEIIALHNAVSEGGAEFYPACSQVKVGGSQTGAPTDNELVTFPGGYSNDDPGIWDKNAYDPNQQYQFPGPPIAAFVGASGTQGGTTPGAGNGGATSTASGYGATATATSAGTGTSAGVATPAPTGQCRLKRNYKVMKRRDLNNPYIPRAIERRTHSLAKSLRSLFSGGHRGSMR